MVHTPFYLVGAQVFVVSVLPDTTKPIKDIAVYWQPELGSEQECHDFHWKYNDFQCEVVDGEDYEVQEQITYESYVVVTFNDNTTETSATVTFTTEKRGTVGGGYVGKISGSADPASSQAAQIEADAQMMIEMWNKAGMPKRTLSFYYDSRADTAYCTTYLIAIGSRYATPGASSDSERIHTYTHELRHYCGVTDQYNQRSGTSYIPHYSQPFKDYRTRALVGLEGCTSSNTVYNPHLDCCYDYCIDDVAKFYFGTPVALINLNYEHSSFNNEIGYVDIFIHKALTSTDAIERQSRWLDTTKSIQDQYIPRVQIVGMDGWIDAAHKSSRIPTNLTWYYNSSEHTFRISGRPDDYKVYTYYPRVERIVTRVYVGDPLTADVTTGIGNFYSNRTGLRSGQVQLNHILLNPNITSIDSDAFVDDVYLETVDILTPSALTMQGHGAFKGCTSLQALNIWSTSAPPSRKYLFGSSSSETIPSGFKIHIPSTEDPTLPKWKGGNWANYEFVADLVVANKPDH